MGLLDSERELQVDPVLYDFAVFDQRFLSYYVDASNISEGLRRSSDCFIDSVFESPLGGPDQFDYFSNRQFSPYMTGGS